MIYPSFPSVSSHGWIFWKSHDFHGFMFFLFFSTMKMKVTMGSSTIRQEYFLYQRSNCFVTTQPKKDTLFFDVTCFPTSFLQKVHSLLLLSKICIVLTDSKWVYFNPVIMKDICTHKQIAGKNAPKGQMTRSFSLLDMSFTSIQGTFQEGTVVHPSWCCKSLAGSSTPPWRDHTVYASWRTICDTRSEVKMIKWTRGSSWVTAWIYIVPFILGDLILWSIMDFDASEIALACLGSKNRHEIMVGGNDI